MRNNVEEKAEEQATKNNPIAKVKEALNRLDNKQKIILVIGIIAIVGMLGLTFSGMKNEEWKVLFSNVSERDGGAIMSALEKENVPHKVNNNGSIMVPPEQVNQLRLKLASQGLPRGGAVGFELLDNQKFGLSSFAEQVNYHRGLEGELARTIQSISAVQNARVHLAIPQKTVFIREVKEPTASVMLNLYPGRVLDSAQIAGISNLVASSVPELNVNNVSITDQNGTLISKSDKGNSLAHGDDQFKYTKNIEKNIEQTIGDILNPILGKENYTVRVNADIDFSLREQTEELYSPNNSPDKQAIRSQVTAETASSGGGGAGGIPGALSNQPPVPATAPIVAGQQQPNRRNGQPLMGNMDVAGITAPINNLGQPINATKNSNVNYEVDKTIKHTKSAQGQIKKLSTSIVVNYRKETGKDGKETNQPIPEEELKRIEDAVRVAMGFNEERGDKLSVINAPFTPQLQIDNSIPFWKDQNNIEYAKEIFKNLLMLVLGWFIWSKMIKPIVNVMTNKDDKKKDGESKTEVGGVLADGSEGGVKEEDYATILEKAKTIAVTDPNSVSHIVKEWMENNGGQPN